MIKQWECLGRAQVCSERDPWWLPTKPKKGVNKGERRRCEYRVQKYYLRQLFAEKVPQLRQGGCCFQGLGLA